MALPKVLILNQPFVSNTGGGITMTNLFSGWEKSQLAVACSGYLMTPEIDPAICNNYYQLGSEERKWLFPMNLISRKYPSGMIKFTDQTKNKVISEEQKSSVRTKIIMNYLHPTLNYLGANHFMARTKLSSRFCKWLDEFNPEVIYAQCASRDGILFCIEVHKYLGKPFLFHMMDDWPSLIGRKGLMKNYWKRKIDLEFKKLLGKVDVAMSISDYMAQEYQKRYNKEFITFHNPINVGFWKSGQRKQYDLDRNIKIMYAGRIGLGIDKSLKTIATAIDTINMELDLSSLFILQAQKNPDWALDYNCVKHQEFVPYDLLPKIFGEVDFLILPYDFTPESLAYIKYSMPTKASEYMASGTPILIYAPKDTALVQYAENYGWASVVTDGSPEELVLRLKELILNKKARMEIAETAKKIAEKRHDDRVVSRKFQQVILDAIGIKRRPA